MTKLTAALPKNPSSNGLATAREQLVRDPLRTRVVVALIDVKKVTHDLDTELDEPTVRILRIEPLDADDAQVAERLMARAWEKRTGQTVLSLDMEDELRSAGVDPGTGEIRG